jgi:hypothetical protein
MPLGVVGAVVVDTVVMAAVVDLAAMMHLTAMMMHLSGALPSLRERRDRQRRNGGERNQDLEQTSFHGVLLFGVGPSHAARRRVAFAIGPSS